MSPAQSITNKAIYDKDQDQYDSLFSKRGLNISFDELKSVVVSDLYRKAWNQDDFGLVTIYVEINESAVKFVIENTNWGYSIRVWVDRRPIYELEGFLSGQQYLSHII